MVSLDDLGNGYESSNIAGHYRAFRPKLHQHILQRCLGGSKFLMGLDIGCGTGQSALALLPYCDEVIALDPSRVMLEKAHQHTQISYAHFTPVTLPLESQSIDFCTFAGSWYYAKSDEMLHEVIRVTRPGGQLCIYDFEVSFSNLESILPSVEKNTAYCYDEDLSGLIPSPFKLIRSYRDSTEVRLNAWEMAHLILAEEIYHRIFAKKDRPDEIHESLTVAIKRIFESKPMCLPADLYASHYIYTP